MSDSTPAATPAPGVEVIDGRSYMIDARGAKVPAEVVRETDKLQDGLVRAIVLAAEPVQAALQAFKTRTFDDVDAFVELLASEYSTVVGGKKGNITLTTYDGLQRVQVQVADHFAFGPELQVAKAGVDTCLNDWAASSGPELRAIVTDAFATDKEGQVNRGSLFRLLRLDIKDERWMSAMKAIRDSMKVEGSRRYVRIYRRARPDAAWQQLSLDLATA